MNGQTELLKEEIIRTAGRQVKTPADFEWLSERVGERTRERLSPTTLKRFFGYLDEEVKPRVFTLDVLARFVGYKDYATFCNQAGSAEVQSNIISEERIAVEELNVGDCIRLTWHPDRICVIRHLGEARFEVIEAQQTKLCVGDTFSCHLFISHEPLYIDHLTHNGQEGMSYVVGRKDGIVFEMM